MNPLGKARVTGITVTVEGEPEPWDVTREERGVSISWHCGAVSHSTDLDDSDDWVELSMRIIRALAWAYDEGKPSWPEEKD